jgi:hypothetical protein
LESSRASSALRFFTPPLGAADEAVAAAAEDEAPGREFAVVLAVALGDAEVEEDEDEEEEEEEEEEAAEEEADAELVVAEDEEAAESSAAAGDGLALSEVLVFLDFLEAAALAATKARRSGICSFSFSSSAIESGSRGTVSNSRAFGSVASARPHTKHASDGTSISAFFECTQPQNSFTTNLFTAKTARNEHDTTNGQHRAAQHSAAQLTAHSSQPTYG